MEESDGVCSTQTTAGSDTAEGTQNNTVLVQKRIPNLLGVTQYFMVLEQEVWNLKKSYRENCLCRTYFNCRLFGEGLARFLDTSG
jgi:hypothetical protein